MLLKYLASIKKTSFLILIAFLLCGLVVFIGHPFVLLIGDGGYKLERRCKKRLFFYFTLLRTPQDEATNRGLFPFNFVSVYLILFLCR